MSACATCGKPIENEAFSGINCQSCFEAEERRTNESRGGILSKIPLAVMVGLIPFFFSFRTSSSTTETVNDQVVAHSGHSIDYVAVALGPVAIVLGILAALAARKGPAEKRTRNLIFAILGIVLGALQIFRGLH